MELKKKAVWLTHWYYSFILSQSYAFQEIQDVAAAKCVPNKWYPGQEKGGSLESVLAKGSKSKWLRQDASSLSAVALDGGTDGLG